MNSQLLKDTAQLLFADHKGMLATEPATIASKSLEFRRPWRLEELTAN
jgi:hypothetical protein